ncbi:MAG: Flp pilus assembly complex ATPase component TadA [Nanoarchaeota archaeon]|nr:Flp pilus assembly complex ATPase component TadA [Nanoarchaeota archaeon]MBU1643730.1 Flp pilus assembly complex ATPase component TadA [Nanoarchaeota archaeon]MBU1976926.1 Flp pilus assembly complex ATPase component TadA [Nanoarchaeota archaeon]
MVINNKNCFDFETYHEGENKILKINCDKCAFPPSIEYSEVCMAKVVDLLMQVTGVTLITLSQQRQYEYGFDQTNLLLELASVYKQLNKDERFSYSHLVANPLYERYIRNSYAPFQRLISKKLKEDPLAAYVELKRLENREKIKLNNLIDQRHLSSQQKFLSILQEVISIIEKTRLINLLMPHTKEYQLGEREIYGNVFQPTTRPDFMYTKLVTAFPEGNLMDSYIFSVGEDICDVNVFSFDNDIKLMYHLTPPEFKFTEEEYELLDDAKRIMSEHKPTREEFVDPERMREVFLNIGKDLITDLVRHKDIKMEEKVVEGLAQALLRHTVGFGMIELLLSDPKVQDVNINSPNGELPIFIVHQDHGDCYTNVYPTALEVESWATKLRLISGRPLDEANPILDTELKVKGFTSRVSAITAPLSPLGLAFSFRRHRDFPWTFPLYIQPKIRYMNAIAAGLLNFIIDNNATILIAGTRSSGKSSLLGSFLVEIKRRARIITIEDTFELPQESLRKLGYNLESMKVASALSSKEGSEVDPSIGIRSTLRMGDSAIFVGEVRSSLRGDQEVVIVEKGLTKRVPIKSLEGKSLRSFFVPTMDEEQKMKLQKLTGFVKHPKRDQLIKLTTKSGREVIVTPDHSVFTHVNFKIAAINTDQLKVGDPIVIPAKIPNDYNDFDHINLLKIFYDNYRLEGAEPYIRKAISKIGWRKASKICGISDIYMYLRPKGQISRIPIALFLKLMKEAKVKYVVEELRVKKGTSLSLPVKFPVNENIMRLLGYYLAEGNNDGKKIQITNSKSKIIEDITEICEKEFGIKIHKRNIKGLGTSTQMYITCKPLSDLFEYWGCGKTSLYKRIPGFVYGLNKRKICALLRGMYSGDGSFSSTKRNGNMVRYFSTSKKLVEDVGYALLSLGIVCRFHGRKLENGKTCYTAEIKQRKYLEQFLQEIGFTHKKPEMIVKSFSHSKYDSVCFDLEELEKHLKLPRKYRHLRKTRCCSKDYLKRVTEEIPNYSDEIYNFAHGEFFIDKVKLIEAVNLKKPEYVYDLSIESTQRFVGGFGGILLHNTEAIALFEAMRVGAAANVVAGTIHADSPYGVYDRVVNDIGVPKTSFKAIDIIVVTNPVISGLKKYKRVLRVTEVRKEWDEDPLKEGAFVDLMVYNPLTDELEITDNLINGNSVILKRMAGRIKEFAGDWDAVWNNIELRAKVKQAIVDIFNQTGEESILEAEFVIKANDQFSLISDKVKEKVGRLDSDKIFFEFNDWLRKEAKKKKVL